MQISPVFTGNSLFAVFIAGFKSVSPVIIHKVSHLSFTKSSINFAPRATSVSFSSCLFSLINTSGLE